MQLHTKFKDHLLAFTELRKTFGTAWNGHLCRLNVIKNRIHFLSDDIRPVHSAPDRAVSTARRSSTASIDWMITEKMFEQDNTE